MRREGIFFFSPRLLDICEWKNKSLNVLFVLFRLQYGTSSRTVCTRTRCCWRSDSMRNVGYRFCLFQLCERLFLGRNCSKKKDGKLVSRWTVISNHRLIFLGFLDLERLVERLCFSCRRQNIHYCCLNCISSEERGVHPLVVDVVLRSRVH
jgi:hypothetical protein